MSLQYLVQGLNIKVNAFVFTDVSAALSLSRKVNLGDGALGAHWCRFRPNCRKSLCHASFQRWFWITHDFSSAVSMPSQGLQWWQRSRLLQRVRGMAICVCISYLAKQGARGGEEVEHKSLWILLYSSWDRWAVISLQGTNYRVFRPLHACGLLASFHSLEHHSHTPLLIWDKMGSSFRWPCCLSHEVLPPWFVSFSGERGETQEYLVKYGS